MAVRRRRAGVLNETLIHITLLAMIALSLYPILLVIFDSFKNPLQYLNERWTFTVPIRLDNYLTAWSETDTYLLNTVIVCAIGTAGMLVLSLIGGHVFARMQFPFKETLYYMIIALLMVPWIVSLVPAYVLYKQLGLIDSLAALIVPNIAAGQVFGIFLLRTFISGLPGELYEAAAIDGAGWSTLIFRITLPLSLPALAVLTVLNVVAQWNSFLWPLIVISKDSQQVISVGLYQLTQAATQSNTGGIDLSVWGPVYAGYVIAAVPLVLIFLALGKFYVEGLVSSGLKL